MGEQRLGGTVARIDPALEPPKVVNKLDVSNRPQGLAVVDGALWVGVADTGARHRGGTLRVEEPFTVTRNDLDPALSYWFRAWQFLNLTNDGLTAFRREGGVGGAEVVAEPRGGPADPLRGRPPLRVPRAARDHVCQWRARAPQPHPLRHRAVGASAGDGGRLVRQHSRGPRLLRKRCDLSRGVVADDAAGTIGIRLVEPDADLLYKLALPFAVALPPSVGLAAPARRPLPTTGPYRVAEFESARFLRLERNPGFRSWSVTARPDGYPDAIVARFGGSRDAAVDRVLDGRADLMFNLSEALPGRLATLRRRVPEQLRETLTPSVSWFILNTGRAPFDRVDARRAVAFALDRRAAVVAGGGRAVAHETCQILPSGFPGSRPYCPFTLPGTGGAAGRPDLARARRLVRRSGTRGMRVEVLAPDEVPPDVPRLVTRTLRTLGYDAVLRLQSPGRHFETLNDTSKGAQIGLSGWIADYPAPSTFLDTFSCAALTRGSPTNMNPSQLCDRKADRLMAAAKRVQAVDPSAADALWARAEHRIVDLAPAVSAYNLISADLVSDRVGNYQYQPGVRRPARTALGALRRGRASRAARPGEARQRVRRRQTAGAQAAADEEHRARRTPGDLQPRPADALARPALGEPDHERAGAGGRRDHRVRADADEHGLGRDAHAALERERGARQQPAGVAAVVAAHPEQVQRTSPASQAPTSTAAQSWAWPANGTSTGAAEVAASYSPPATRRRRRPRRASTVCRSPPDGAGMQSVARRGEQQHGAASCSAARRTASAPRSAVVKAATRASTPRARARSRRSPRRALVSPTSSTSPSNATTSSSWAARPASCPAMAARRRRGRPAPAARAPSGAPALAPGSRRAHRASNPAPGSAPRAPSARAPARSRSPRRGACARSDTRRAPRPGGRRGTARA